jgi:hypothetical protein
MQPPDSAAVLSSTLSPSLGSRRTRPTSSPLLTGSNGQLDVQDPDGLATQLMLLVDGAIAAALVRGDPKMAGAAREAARVLLIAFASAAALFDVG